MLQHSNCNYTCGSTVILDYGRYCTLWKSLGSFCMLVLWVLTLSERVFVTVCVNCLSLSFCSQQSVQHENTYRDPIAKYCYGEYPPELLPVWKLHDLSRKVKELETRIQKSKTTAAALQEPHCKWFMVFSVANPEVYRISKRLKFCGIESCFLQLILCTCFGALEGAFFESLFYNSLCFRMHGVDLAYKI